MGATQAVGVFLPVRATESIAFEGHHGEFAGALEQALRAHHRAVTIFGTTRHDDIPRHAASLCGAVLLGFREDELLALPPLGVPAVAIDSYTQRDDFTVVRIDDRDGGYRAGASLALWGHADVLFVGPPADGSGVVSERREGFARAMDEAGVTHRTHATVGTARREGVALGRSLAELYAGVTAVFATADTLALGVIEGLTLSGLDVPGDVSVMGFDGLALASMSTPKLSTVAQDIPRKARLAAEALMLGVGASDVLILGVEIIKRASVGAPPADRRRSS
jgi:LacI family transcriptional regulator